MTVDLLCCNEDKRHMNQHPIYSIWLLYKHLKIVLNQGFLLLKVINPKSTNLSLSTQKRMEYYSIFLFPVESDSI